jgi:hypothetical protein
MKKESTALKANTPPQPHGTAAAFEALLRSSMDELLIKTRAHQEDWDFGEHDQWFLNQGSAELVFTFPDFVVSASPQVIGTFDTDDHLWTWAWADSELPDHLKVASLRVKDYGAQHGFQHLLTPSWPAEESHCWYMTALACRLCGSEGAFRGVSGNVHSFISFCGVEISSVTDTPAGTDLDGLTAEAVEDFKGCLENPEEQRQASIRFLKRGAMAGFPQEELIHQLGLGSPSILDLAGYSADLAENVMGMLKTISDEDILYCSA